MVVGPNGQGSINGGPRGQMKHMVDPFGKINPKARKLIESMERNRQHNNQHHAVAERRTGSTGGTSTQYVDLTEAVSAHNSRAKMMNQTT